jgi:serine protease Do
MSFPNQTTQMKSKLIIIICATALLPIAAVTQEPPNPPGPPNAPGGPGTPARPPGPLPRERNEKKVPVTFLGIETSEVPTVVCEQLGLPKGFGLVVDYVVPNSPAAAAGVQQNDIIKMLNDQILTEPEQLSKLVRSYSEGTNVTLTVLRKGKEEKITVKLSKKEVPQHELERGHHRQHGFPFDERDFGDFGMNDLKEQMDDLKEQLGDERRGMIHDAVIKAREAAAHARDQAREQIERAGDQIRILSKDTDAFKTTKIDIGKAQIVCSDNTGELRVEKIDGKKVLTAKDPQGRLLFSGPVETDEDLAKVPADVRERYDKLQQNELPAITQPVQTDEGESIETESDDDELLTPEQVSARAAASKMSIL